MDFLIADFHIIAADSAGYGSACEKCITFVKLYVLILNYGYLNAVVRCLKINTLYLMKISAILVEVTMDEMR